MFNLQTTYSKGAYSLVPASHVDASTELYGDLVSFVEAFQRKGILKASIPRAGALNRSISKT